MTGLVRHLDATLISLSPYDAVFSHPGAKGAGVQTKEYRCAVFTFDAPTGFLKYLEDVVVFEVEERFDLLT
jgi:hypothetical protein